MVPAVKLKIELRAYFTHAMPVCDIAGVGEYLFGER